MRAFVKAQTVRIKWVYCIIYNLCRTEVGFKDNRGSSELGDSDKRRTPGLGPLTIPNMPQPPFPLKSDGSQPHSSQHVITVVNLESLRQISFPPIQF